MILLEGFQGRVAFAHYTRLVLNGLTASLNHASRRVHEAVTLDTTDFGHADTGSVEIHEFSQNVKELEQSLQWAEDLFLPVFIADSGSLNDMNGSLSP